MKIRNPKLEIRSKFEIRNGNVQNAVRLVRGLILYWFHSFDAKIHFSRDQEFLKAKEERVLNISILGI